MCKGEEEYLSWIMFLVLRIEGKGREDDLTWWNAPSLENWEIGG